MPATEKRQTRILLIACVCVLAAACPAMAGDAPQWMHTAASAPLPAHDEKTDAVLLYEETNVNVISAEKVKTQVRRVYKILRPSGRERGTVFVNFDIPAQKVTSLHGWCIPAQGKDYEVKDKDSLEMSPRMIQGIELVDDVKAKVLQIPAPDPGNIVGYEFEIEERPIVLQDYWPFQREIPVREAHYSLQLPPGWEYKASWLNHAEIKPTQSGNNQWQWVVTDVSAIRPERNMPPFEGIAAGMIVSYFSADGPSVRYGFSNWREMGAWYWNLFQGRLDPSPEIKQKVAALTASKNTRLQKMQAVAEFVQHDIRYVAIELGIGGWQPHPAPQIFAHHYGDCKDKATLVRSMLREIGVDSYQVAINTERGSITPEIPAHQGFNHQIAVIKLPDDVQDPSLLAMVVHPKLGRLLFFDPTDEITPFGQIPGYLQANYGLIVTGEGGELIELPKQSPSTNSVQRAGTLTLDPTGTLKGEVTETRLGDRASTERWRLRTITKDADRIKPIEDLLAGSLSLFRITQATVTNLSQTDQPFGFHYAFEAQSYAKYAGGLLLVRPRVLGVKASGILETKEARKFPVEFEGPARDTDTFDIAIPAGYVVDDVPPAVDADYGFASYHSKTEVKGNLIHYSRTFEVKELSVPVAKVDELKKFYRIIAGDERNTVVLKAAQ
ncbi:MAG TPA: DUF3857 and transglutaminase domain-containing protein [Candidatus Dormibacteraeota bacterium]|nr:DUF3857 and transglutaminase domain-containing protein [Candidatus Dormibacteraeota bacterium]